MDIYAHTQHVPPQLSKLLGEFTMNHGGRMTHMYGGGPRQWGNKDQICIMGVTLPRT